MDSSYSLDLDSLTILYSSHVSHSRKNRPININKINHLRRIYFNVGYEDATDTPCVDPMRQVGMTTQLVVFFFIVHCVVTVVVLYDGRREDLN